MAPMAPSNRTFSQIELPDALGLPSSVGVSGEHCWTSQQWHTQFGSGINLARNSNGGYYTLSSAAGGGWS